MLKNIRGAVRLVYLTGRACLHIISTPSPIGAYCIECNSVMERLSNGSVRIVASGRPCPVHIAWRELVRAGVEP